MSRVPDGRIAMRNPKRLFLCLRRLHLVLVALVLALVQGELRQTHAILRGEGFEEVGFVVGKGGGVVAVEVSDAQASVGRIRTQTDGFDQAVERQERQGVGTDEIANLLDRFLSGDELLGGGDVDAIETRIFQRW